MNPIIYNQLKLLNMKKTYYLPDADAERLNWLINFYNKISGTTGYGATLGLTPAQLIYLLNGLKMYTYIFALMTAAESFYHTCTSFKDGLNAVVIGTVPQAIPVFNAPTGAPTITVPAGFFAWILELVASIKTNPVYTNEMGIDLKIIGSNIVIDWATAQPTKVKVTANAGAVHGVFLKGQATGGRIECKRGTETTFTTVTEVSGAKFTDPRHNLVFGVPETRQYRIWYLKNNTIVGLVSSIVTLSVND